MSKGSWCLSFLHAISASCLQSLRGRQALNSAIVSSLGSVRVSHGHHTWLHHDRLAGDGLHARLHARLHHTWLHHARLHTGLHTRLHHARLHAGLHHTWLHTRLHHAWLHGHTRLHHTWLHHAGLHTGHHAGHLLLSCTMLFVAAATTSFPD